MAVDRELKGDPVNCRTPAQGTHLYETFPDCKLCLLSDSITLAFQTRNLSLIFSVQKKQQVRWSAPGACMVCFRNSKEANPVERSEQGPE